MKKVYLDTSVWCRPFDKPSPRVDAERKAFLKILRRVYRGEFTVVGSIFLDIEVERIEGDKKKEGVKDSMNRIISEKIEVISGNILSKKKEIQELVGLRDMDAYHLACAIENAKYFISVDDEILRKREKVEKGYEIKICSPMEFLEIEGE